MGKRANTQHDGDELAVVPVCWNEQLGNIREAVMRAMILMLVVVGYVAVAAAADKYVEEWPKKLGTTWNPSPEQCRAAGYELISNKPAPTADELAKAAEEQARIAEEKLRQSEAASNSAARIQVMIAAYRQTCAAIASEAGLTLTSNVLTAAQIEQACLPLSEDVDTPTKIKRNFKLLSLVLKLENQHRLMTQEGINAY